MINTDELITEINRLEEQLSLNPDSLENNLCCANYSTIVGFCDEDIIHLEIAKNKWRKLREIDNVFNTTSNDMVDKIKKVYVSIIKKDISRYSIASDKDGNIKHQIVDILQNRIDKFLSE